MHRLLKRQPWTCARCLRKQQQVQRRLQSNATATVDSSVGSRVYHPPEPSSHPQDINVLRKIFDSQPFWRDFSQQASQGQVPSGLIGNRHLRTANGFQVFADQAIKKCEAILKKTLAASTVSEYTAIAKDLDRVSDLLCRVIDLSDFIRATHPNPQYIKAATRAYLMVFEYMNVYNTETRLNAQLKRALSMPEVTSQWTGEERAVAEILMKDFARSGIDLPTEQREKFVSLSNEISQAGTEFVNGMDFANDHVTLPSSQLYGVDPTLVRRLTNSDKAVIPLYNRSARIVASTAHDEATRKAIYIADRTASTKSIGRLQKLLRKRAALAKLTGYESYGQMAMVDKMAKSPEAVNNFLTTLNASNRGQMQNEIKGLLEAGKNLNRNTTTLRPWDHGFLVNRLMRSPLNASRTSRSRLNELLPSYFSPGNVIAGLSQLFNRLYGVRFVAKSVASGECWDSSVRRLDVYTDTQEHVAVLYCDLFVRPGKPTNPAHFTLLCSREITDEEIENAQNTGQHPNDGMPISVTTSPTTGKATHHQLPTIALVCDFPEPSGASGQPALLSLQSLTTLFHEMGHAIHSILGRTSMQGIAGTRCATDFAELPSILMEYFATDPSVLQLFARHWETDEPMPLEMMEALRKQQMLGAEMTGAWENESQILMAMLDQAYHSEEVTFGQRTLGRTYDSTAVFHRVWDEHGSIREPPETAWQGFFGHLYGYGASYYSYLFDRAIARQVWRSVFLEGRGATDREQGEKFKNGVLKWGGGKDPWLCLEEILGDGKGILAEGGEKAMLEVGKWGIGASSEGAM